MLQKIHKIYTTGTQPVGKIIKKLLHTLEDEDPINPRILKRASYLRIATVRASDELAHGQITSGRKPRDWNTFTKASHDDIDPAII